MDGKMRGNWGHWTIVVLGLMMAQFAGAQTEDQEYRLINNMTADSGSVTNADGTVQSCTPSSTHVANRCWSDSGWAYIPIHVGFSRGCPGEHIVFKVEGSANYTSGWTCGANHFDQHITLTGTISACGRGTLNYAFSCR